MYHEQSFVRCSNKWLEYDNQAKNTAIVNNDTDEETNMKIIHILTNTINSNILIYTKLPVVLQGGKSIKKITIKRKNKKRKKTRKLKTNRKKNKKNKK